MGRLKTISTNLRTQRSEFGKRPTLGSKAVKRSASINRKIAKKTKKLKKNAIRIRSNINDYFDEDLKQRNKFRPRNQDIRF